MIRRFLRWYIQADFPRRLTLEEMDVVFGSSGVAAADQERMRQINDEIGLTRALGYTDANSSDEKIVGKEATI